MKFVTAVSLLACLSFGCAACTIDASGVHVFASNDLKEKAERVDARDLNLAAGKSLHVEISFGDIHVRAAEGEKGSMHATIRARAKTKEEVKYLLERTSVLVNETTDEVQVRLGVIDHDKTLEQTPAVDFEIAAPAGLTLDLVTSSGRVVADGAWFARAKLESSFGDVKGEHMHGEVHASSSSGKVELADVQCGPGVTIDAHSSFGDVVVARVECDTLKAVTSSGKVHVDHVRAKSIDAESDFGDVVLADIDGAITAKSNSGAVRAERASGPTILLHSSFGAVVARSAKGTLTLDTSSGDVKVEDVEGKLDAKTGFGQVEADGLFTALHAESSSGNVHVHARKGSRADNWTLSSGFGSVLLEAPADFAFDLDATTGFGKVACGYPTGAKSKPDESTALHAQINGGGGKIHAESSSGDVRIRPAGE